ncbi:MAG: hypothetical protein WCD89_10465 [Anaerocolumna sp.]
MIKLERPDKPSELSKEKMKDLTETYKKTGKAVWRENYIVKKLNEMSHDKCCYCELKLNVQSREMQVEHYHYKDKYVDEVVEWKNLLPSCKQCNSNKGIWDTVVDPIINPTDQNPKDFFYLKFYMIKSKDNDRNSIGYKTIELLDLNNRKRLVNLRIELADAMFNKLADTYDKLETYKFNKSNTRLKNKIIKTIKDILSMAQPDSEFSAVIATMLLNYEDYIEIKDSLNDLELWDEELEKLHNNSNRIKFDLF